MEDIPADRSVTCLFCGGHADERETELVTDDLEEIGPTIPVDRPVEFGAVMKAVAEYGRGEGHTDCFDRYLAEYKQGLQRGDEPAEKVKSVRLAVDGEHLDPTNDLHYLVALATEAKRYDGKRDGDPEGAAKWTVTQWCQEIGWVPDLSAYDAGEQVPRSDELELCEASFGDGGAGPIADTEIIPRDELEQTGETAHGPTYQCPRCEYESVTEDCDCPECGWAGMCQKGWRGSEKLSEKGGDTRA